MEPGIKFAITFTRTLSIVIMSFDSEAREFLFSCWICTDVGNPILNGA